MSKFFGRLSTFFLIIGSVAGAIVVFAAIFCRAFHYAASPVEQEYLGIVLLLAIASFVTWIIFGSLADRYL